ncbi:MAG: hypothetical protein RJA49_507 [Actinomycetota bacterium]|jgi:hypothetical protein
MSTARRPLSFVLALVTSLTVLAPVAAHASDTVVHRTVSVGAVRPRTDGDADDAPSATAAAPSTTAVASEGPVPNNPGGAAPEIGPIVVPTESSAFSGAWWLVAFGGVQLIGLLLITRRARSRLSPQDAQP